MGLIRAESRQRGDSGIQEATAEPVAAASAMNSVNTCFHIESRGHLYLNSAVIGCFTMVDHFN